jgi:hypothetical protein
MARGSIRSIPFTPPPAGKATHVEPPAEVPTQRALWVEPTEQMLILGEMLRDTQLMLEKLQGLPFSGVGYRGDLRVIRGAAKRTAERCARLIGDNEA